MNRLRKWWLYRGVYPEPASAETGWQIGVRLPKRISRRRLRALRFDLGMSNDVIGFDSYNHAPGPSL